MVNLRERSAEDMSEDLENIHILLSIVSGCATDGKNWKNMIQSTAETIEKLRIELATERKEHQDARSYVAEIAQGISHYPHDEDGPCVRCNLEKERAMVKSLEMRSKSISPDDKEFKELREWKKSLDVVGLTEIIKQSAE